MVQPDIKASVKAVIFDCFGVLYVNPTQYFFEQNLENYEDLRPQLADLDRQFDYGLISSDEQNEALAALTGLDVKFIKDNIRRLHVKNDDLMQLIAKLRKDFKVAMLSNIGRQAMDNFFTEAERKELFDVAVLSGEVGLIKPDPEVFILTAERLGIEPGECLMIDDAEGNCRGAKAAGMEAIHYVDNTSLQRQLSEILMLDKIN